nr:hypothetical protein GCM10020093_105310 [Planobispora longispora]
MEGCEVVIPPSQGCCGALSLHSGRPEEARRFARRTITAFDRAGVDTIVVNAAGCGSTMKEYADLLDGAWAERAREIRTVDLAEYLVELGPVARRHPLPLTAAYHDACHLAHAQGVRSQPRELLTAIPDLEVREIAESAICCGSAGTYNLFQPEAARELGDRKAERVLATGADLLVSANPGCTMQIASAVRRSGAPRSRSPTPRRSWTPPARPGEGRMSTDHLGADTGHANGDRPAAQSPAAKAVNTVQSVDRALDLLEALAGHGGEAGISELAAATGLPYGTIHRLLRTLLDRGYVRQESDRRYALGGALVRLGGMAERLVGVWAQPYLKKMVELSGETANMAVLEGDFIVYVAQAPSPRRLRMFAEVGGGCCRTARPWARSCWPTGRTPR